MVRVFIKRNQKKKTNVIDKLLQIKLSFSLKKNIFKANFHNMYTFISFSKNSKKP